MTEKLKSIVRIVTNLGLYGLTKCIPKKDNLWVFGAWFGQRYSDNPKAFFEYINKNQHHINAIWVSKNEGVVEHIRNLGFKAYTENSFLGIWYQLRAEYAFVCQALQDDIFAPCIGKKTKVVNLWHGLPLKKIMFDVFGDKVKNKNFVGKLFDFLSPYEKTRNDYLLATSEETQRTLSKAFRIPKERTLITGFPRNDVLLNLPKKENSGVYKCIYMPTFRGGKGSECDLFAQYGFDVDTIDKILSENNIELVLRMHPVNKPPQYLIEKINQSKTILIDNTLDIFDSLAEYDCMITDYSGGYFDFLLTGRPILFAPFDLEQYKKQERSLYYEYEDVTLKPYSFDWPELIANLINVKNKSPSNNYYEGYENLVELFHHNLEPEYHSISSKLFQVLSKIE